MNSISIRQIWNIFYKELSPIKGAGLIFILIYSIVSFAYLVGFLLELPKFQVTQGMVTSISSHESYSSRYGKNRTYYEANINFTTGDDQFHSFESFAIGRQVHNQDDEVKLSEALSRAEEFCSDIIYTAESVEVERANKIIAKISKRIG